MKAVFVESKNGYLARGPNDDMSWTPSLDKKLFRTLVYAYGGTCVCSKHTFSLLPTKMIQSSGRTYIIAQRDGPNTLQNLAKVKPNAVLIGGPTFLSAAYDLGVIDTFIISTVNVEIESSEQYANKFRELLGRPSTTVNFDELTLRIYNIKKELNR